MLYGALEAGGTKMVCALGDENGTILEQTSIPTTTPEETLSAIIDWFRDKEIASLGVACFGPIDLRRNSPTYGYITTTPKKVWANVDIVGILKRALGVPVGFDTDVNGSLLGEVTYGQARGLTDAVYITIGTGVGAGILSGGHLVHGMLHPEFGHIPVVKHPDDMYEGHCPYHGSCFEGMAAGPAIEERWGQKAITLKDDPKVWDIEAHYIAEACTTLIMTLSPQIIILGGGVMHQAQLFPLIREKVKSMVNGYVLTDEFADLDHYIVPASLHDDQGIMGAIKLAIDEVYGV
ncbi:MAG: ROK family protein [Oliverpabstia sp.]|nr:ROK family protein [Oribacterium sp.]MDY2854241.1 ROK family protein [Oliverpabstia sp.]